MGKTKEAQAGFGATARLWAVRMADSVLARHPVLTEKWDYTAGLVLSGLCEVWRETGEIKYFRYLRETVDRFVGPGGEIRTYDLEEYNLDQINMGKVLFPLWEETKEEKYRRAIAELRAQLRDQPRTREGGFWHKLIYPYQMWLDGIYMAAPFYAQFARVFDEPEIFDDVAHQILLIAAHTKDPVTGLFYHGWDETGTQIWADPRHGHSPCFWGRAMGWYAMAIVDVLDFLPPDHPQYPAIVALFREMVAALLKVQDPATGLWYQILDQGHRPGNYHEASASCMFVYAMAKGLRRDLVPPAVLTAARQGYEGILRRLVEVDAEEGVHLKQICQVAGLGGKANRDGSYEYYLSEPVVTDDYKGVGAFILAGLEMARTEEKP
ncbi:MAG: glycosyl hydrolase family 88 [Firmicutes bacterium]|nr:glycosyl hydrolase family 88 [Bacillota bacterium]